MDSREVKRAKELERSNRLESLRNMPNSKNSAANRKGVIPEIKLEN